MSKESKKVMFSKRSGITQIFSFFIVAALLFSGCPQPQGSDPGETTLLPVPETPRNVTVRPGNKRLIVSWDDVSRANSYEVFWGEGAESPKEAVTTRAIVDGLENGKTYWVKVRSKNNAGLSEFSSPVEGTPAIQTPAPSVIRGDGTLSVGWVAEEGVDYEVYYGTGSSSGSAVQWGGAIAGSSSVPGTVITGLTNGNTYYVWIKAKVVAEGFSEFGSGTSGKPEAAKSPPAGFVYVPGGTITGNESYAMSVKVPSGQGYMNGGKTLTKKGVFVEDREVALDSFFMAKYETTRQLWSEVVAWAKSNGYAFQNENTGVSDNKPISNISWRDAIVWCNAYSQKSGLEPVYYSDGGVLKNSRDANGTACDNVVMDKSKNGFRLPTETEREFAARGGDPGKADWMFLYAGSDNPDAVAWHHGNSPYQIKDVGTKSANRLGIYDLSGNVQEWGWDWMNYGVAVPPATPWDGMQNSSGLGQKPMAGGGVGSNVTMSCVADRWGYVTSYTDNWVGFRVVRKAE